MRDLPDWLVEGVLNDPFSVRTLVDWTIDRKTWYPLRPLSGTTTEDANSQTRWAFSK